MGGRHGTGRTRLLGGATVRMPNEGSNEPLAAFAVTVDAVEKATGLDFFSKVPEEEQDRLERTISVKAWKGL